MLLSFKGLKGNEPNSWLSWLLAMWVGWHLWCSRTISLKSTCRIETVWAGYCLHHPHRLVWLPGNTLNAGWSPARCLWCHYLKTNTPSLFLPLRKSVRFFFIQEHFILIEPHHFKDFYKNLKRVTECLLSHTHLILSCDNLQISSWHIHWATFSCFKINSF